MLRGSILAIALITLGTPAEADIPSQPNTSRGNLLYSTHCIACHTTEVHWRDKKLVTDRQSLKREVGRWQAFSRLGWSDDDIEAVTRYLNMLYYRYPSPD